MLKLTLYKGEKLQFTHRQTGEVINVNILRTAKTCVKVDVDARAHWKILRTDRRERCHENSNTSR